MVNTPKQITLTDEITAYFNLRHTPKDSTACWEWFGGLNKAGYGAIRLTKDGKTTEYAAHRYAYTLLVGPIPEGLTIDHTCVNPPCVNPAHMEPVTGSVNSIRRGERGALKTHCKHGHAFTDENTYRNPGSVTRVCRTCFNARYRAKQLGIGVAEYFAREHELDPLFNKVKRNLTPRPGSRYTVDWSKPAHCTSCNRLMRHHTDKPDGITVPHAAKGRCGTCYKRARVPLLTL